MRSDLLTTFSTGTWPASFISTTSKVPAASASSRVA